MLGGQTISVRGKEGEITFLCLSLILHRIESFTRHVDARHTGQAGRPERGLAHGAHAHRLPRRGLHAAQQGCHKLSLLVWALIRSLPEQYL